MKLHIYIIIILITFFYSCVEIVDMENDFEDNISISSLFSKDDDSLKVFITKTTEIFEDYSYDFPYYRNGYNIKPEAFITDAEVFISTDSVNYTKLEQKDLCFYFPNNSFLCENNNYYLKTNYESETFVAQTTIPSKSNILRSEITGNTYFDRNGNELLEIELEIEDIKNSENYYEIKLYKLESDNEKIKMLYYIYSPLLNNQVHDDYQIFSIFFSDELFQNTNLIVDLRFLPYSTSNSYIVEVVSLSEELYTYKKMLQKYFSIYNVHFSIETGFTTPAAAITMYSNIIDGYGLFAGYTIHTDTISVQ